MDIANMIMDASRKQALNAIKNNESDLCIGTMSGTSAVTLETGYTISGDLLDFTQFCYDCVIDLPYKGGPMRSHVHEVDESLTDMMGVTSAGPVMFVPAGSPDLPDLDPTKPISPEDWEKIIAMGGETLAQRHTHTVQPALPQIRLWRGVKDGDRVLVLKVNTRHFVVLCRLGAPTNEEEQGGKGYAPCDA